MTLPVQLSQAQTSSVVSLQNSSVDALDPSEIREAAAIDTCCFDKTGTLTRPDVTYLGSNCASRSSVASMINWTSTSRDGEDEDNSSIGSDGSDSDGSSVADLSGVGIAGRSTAAKAEELAVELEQADEMDWHSAKIIAACHTLVVRSARIAES